MADGAGQRLVGPRRRVTHMNGPALLTAPIAGTIARLSAPNVVAMFVMLATSMAEAWYVGQLGTTALAGLALAFPMFMLMTMLSAGAIGGAIAGAVAQAMGAGDRRLAETLALHAVIIAVVAAAVFAALFLSAGRPIFAALGGRGDALDQALAYSDLLFAGGNSIWLANTLSSVVRACGHMRIAAGALMTGSACQVVLGGLLVFGVGPFPALGIAGVALAAVIGFGLGALLLAAYLVSGRAGLTLRFSGLPVRAVYFANLLKVGLLASVSPLTSVATVIVVTGFVARLGDPVLAGYGIGARLEFLMIPLIFGIGAALITMVGVHFGAGQVERGHQIAWTGAIAAAAITGTVGVVLALFPGLWADLFTDDETVRAACRTYLRIAGPFYAFFGLGLCLYFASQGARRVFWPVLAGIARLGMILAGGALIVVTSEPTPQLVFALIGAGMLLYGLTVAGAVRLGAWR